MTETPTPPTPPTEPHPTLVRLGEELVGTWTLTGHSSDPAGDLSGTVSFEWMDGGFFLVQHVDIDFVGHPVKGVEYIRHDEERQEIRSHYFDTAGSYLSYVYELDGDQLTIWGGEVGSPAKYTGRISADRTTQTGAWEWPGAVTRPTRPGTSG